jgi:hypothetical protein
MECVSLCGWILLGSGQWAVGSIHAQSKWLLYLLLLSSMCHSPAQPVVYSWSLACMMIGSLSLYAIALYIVTTTHHRAAKCHNVRSGPNVSPNKMSDFAAKVRAMIHLNLRFPVFSSCHRHAHENPESIRLHPPWHFNAFLNAHHNQPTDEHAP